MSQDGGERQENNDASTAGAAHGLAQMMQQRCQLKSRRASLVPPRWRSIAIAIGHERFRPALGNLAPRHDLHRVRVCNLQVVLECTGDVLVRLVSLKTSIMYCSRECFNRCSQERKPKRYCDHIVQMHLQFHRSLANLWWSLGYASFWAVVR